MEGEKRMKLELFSRKFPENIAHLLLFEKFDDRIVIKAKKPLTIDDFCQVVGIMNSLGGKWVPAGKDSHFEIIESQLRRIC